MFSKEIYVERRKKLKANFKSGIILICGNTYSPLDYKDNCYPFIQDATFKYYFGLDNAGLVGIIDIDENKEIIFGNDYTMDDIIWMGKQKYLKEYMLDIGVAEFREKDELKAYLSKRENIMFTTQYRAENILFLSKLLDINPLEFDKYISLDLTKAIIKQRNIKEDYEISEIEKAVNITREMHITAMTKVANGMKEYELVAEVEKMARMYDAYFSFTTILTKNGQILHNHNRSNILKNGDLVLLDCGAINKEGYCGDMTSTFPVNGKYTSRQRAIHNIVRDMFDKSISLIKEGIEYRTVHLEACKVMATRLKELGLMKGEVEDIIRSGAHALFMPHGLGHMMGMTVHDMENFGEDNVGYDETTVRSKQFGLASLRLAKKLEIGNVLTVEPGIYFIPDLVEKWKNQKLHEEFLKYDEIEKYLDFGGIRMERDILVTPEGNRILGDKFARTADEIEKYMQK